MGKLTGQITCAAASTIEPGCVAKVEVRDVSIACGPSTVNGSVTINNPMAFPLSYELDFDDNVEEFRTLTVSARFERDGKLEFINDTRFEIRGEDGKFKSNVDFFVIKV